MATTNKINWTPILIAIGAAWFLYKYGKKIFGSTAAATNPFSGGGGGSDALGQNGSSSPTLPNPFSGSASLGPGGGGNPKQNNAGVGGLDDNLGQMDVQNLKDWAQITQNLDDPGYGPESIIGYDTVGDLPNGGFIAEQPIVGAVPYNVQDAGDAAISTNPSDTSFWGSFGSILDGIFGSTSGSGDSGLIVPSTGSGDLAYADTSGLTYAPDSSPSNDVPGDSGDNGYDVASYDGSPYDQGGGSGNPSDNSGGDGGGGGGGDVSNDGGSGDGGDSGGDSADD
jgi:hypothetical protein